MEPAYKERKLKTSHLKHVEKLREVTKEPDEGFPKRDGTKAANRWEYGHHAKKTRSMVGAGPTANKPGKGGMDYGAHSA